MAPDQLDCFLLDHSRRQLGSKCTHLLIFAFIELEPSHELFTPGQLGLEFIVAKIRHVTLFEFYGHDVTVLEVSTKHG